MNPQIAAADDFAKYRSMLRDESLYPDASAFKPERFMEADPDKRRMMDPRNYIFGFGRRLVSRLQW
jgi:cytochrome P450